MTKTSMPLGVTNGSSCKSTLEGRKRLRLDWIEARLTSPFQQASSRLSVLNRKGPRMIFKEDVIITRKFMDRKEMLSNVRNMQNIT